MSAFTNCKNQNPDFQKRLNIWMSDRKVRESAMLQTNLEVPKKKRLLFSLPEFFLGRTQANGFFETSFGKVKKTFSADITGFWKDDQFCMNEHFEFSDGTAEDRSWFLVAKQEGIFQAHCSDIASPVLVRHEENTATMSYTIGLSIADKKVNVRFTDLFVMLSDTSVLNRSSVSKWGLPIGRLVISFSKLQD